MQRLSIALLSLVLTSASAYAADTLPGPAGITVHEWGTFTSVAAPDGSAANWTPFHASPDLPCFVVRRGPVNFKSIVPFTVRMETPVLYFYSQRAADISINVEFNNGVITEWYPETMGASSFSQIQWHAHLAPGRDLDYPIAAGASHYFAARATDATPLRVGKEAEKMLFYRGAGMFIPPVTVAFLPDGGAEIRNSLQSPLPFAVVFENRGGKLAYRTFSDVGGKQAVGQLNAAGSLDDVTSSLAQALQKAGMYPKEAAAMVETWRDSWFETGMRLFYIVPRTFVNATLPIHMEPAPEKVERAFVGRVELMPDWRLAAVETALAGGDIAVLQREGRFLEPLMNAARRPGHWNLVQSPAAAAFIQASRQQQSADFREPGCVK